jgi:hypothetical protein
VFAALDELMPERCDARQRLLAMAATLEARGNSLTSGPGLEYRRAIIERFAGRRTENDE